VATSEEDRVSGVQWLAILRRHFARSVWLNPETTPAWGGSTVETIAGIFPMYSLTIHGLEEALGWLKRRI